MKITDDAREIIKAGLAANNCDCLEAALQQSCCGTSVSFSINKMTDDDKAEIINEIPVIMNDEIQKRVELVTIYAENGELLFQDDAPSSCSSCSSCSAE